MARQKTTEKCTSHYMQNEILMLIAHKILCNLAEEIRSSFYALICDEYTNISNKEQLTLCWRYIDGCFSVYEDLLGFYEVLNIKSGTIVSAMKRWNDFTIGTNCSMQNEETFNETYDLCIKEIQRSFISSKSCFAAVL